MEAKKRAVACLVGGIFGMLVALAVKQALEWLWVTAGMIAGASLAYFCYDLRQVFKKIPIAWQKTFSQISDWWVGKNQMIENWKPTEFFKFFFGVSSFTMVVLNCLFISFLPPETIENENLAELNVVNFFVSLSISCFFYYAGFLLGLVLLMTAWLGEINVEKKFSFPFFIPFFLSEEKITNLKEKGLTKTTPTVTLLFRWSLEGILFIPFAIFRFGVPFLIKIVISLVKFVWVLIRLIHSKGRIASAFYSALAILVSCLFWGRTAETPAESAFAIISAGIIGAALGSLSSKISQHLGLAPNK